jgi:hypothetical protein
MAEQLITKLPVANIATFLELPPERVERNSIAQISHPYELCADLSSSDTASSYRNSSESRLKTPTKVTIDGAHPMRDTETRKNPLSIESSYLMPKGGWYNQAFIDRQP